MIFETTYEGSKSRRLAARPRLTAETGLSDVARFAEGDAFVGEGVAAFEPRPTLAVVSGLHGLYSIFLPVYGFLFPPMAAASRGDATHFPRRAALAPNGG